MKFDVGEVIKIANCLGNFDVTIDRELDYLNTRTGVGTDKLPAFEKPRLEFHKTNDGYLVTICEAKYNFPADMYLFLIDRNLEHKVCAYKGHYDTSEIPNKLFTTIEEDGRFNDDP